MPQLIYNLITYQIAWPLCIFSAAYNSGWIAVLYAILVVPIHFYIAKKPAEELKTVFTITLLGFAVDSLHQISGVLYFKESFETLRICPPWLIALWFLFATTINTCWSWLKGRYFLAAFIGGTLGTVTYWAGAKLGAADMGMELLPTIIILAIAWSLLLPATIRIAEHFQSEKIK